jgi:hypothetical protein
MPVQYFFKTPSIMPPKKVKAPPATRTAFDGSIEQQCHKCQNWKPQLPDYKAARGNKIVDTCQGCRNDMNALYQAKKNNRSGLTREQDDNAESVTSSTIVVDTGMGGDGVMGEAEPEAVGPVYPPICTYST